eukprot:Gb_30567 [translate_table: standard]
MLFWLNVYLPNLERSSLVILLCLARQRDPRKIICKRVVGLEGDPMKIYAAGHGEENQPDHGEESQPDVVPTGHIWIQGDNLSLSNDSRHFGPVPSALLQGKLLLRIWPIDGFGFLN